MSGSSNNNNNGANNGGRGAGRQPPTWNTPPEQNDPAFDLEPLDPAREGSRRYDPAQDPRYAPRSASIPGQPPVASPRAGLPPGQNLGPQLGDNRLSLSPEWNDAALSRRIPQLSTPEPTRPMGAQGYPQQQPSQDSPSLPRAPYEVGRYAPIEPLPTTAPRRAEPAYAPVELLPEQQLPDTPQTQRAAPLPDNSRIEPTQRPPQPQADFGAPARDTRRSARQLATASPIVPPKTVAGKSLTLVVAIMCCLASLTAGAVYLINQSANGWMRDIASEVTVQIEPRDRVDIEKALRDTAAFLERQPGVKSARPLSFEESAAPLEAWLGSSSALKELPVPRLISLQLDPSRATDLSKLEADMQKVSAGARIDDHRVWLRQIRTMTRSFSVGGLIILVLMAAATFAVIISAARGALLANKEIVEVLHFVGATDKFIAREFQSHFLRVGIKAGIFGAIVAVAFFAALPFLFDLIGSGTVRMTEWRRIVGTGALDLMGYLVLLGVVVSIAAICWLVSRMGVYKILRSGT